MLSSISVIVALTTEIRVFPIREILESVRMIIKAGLFSVTCSPFLDLVAFYQQCSTSCDECEEHGIFFKESALATSRRGPSLTQSQMYI